MQATTSTTNRDNAQHSTGPRTPEGKARSAQNALTHGLTSRTAVLPSEDPAAFELHCQKLKDEYQPKTATEVQLVQELADTSWRLNRIPFLEADLLSRATNPPNEQAAIDFDIVDAHRLLPRQFQKTLQLLCDTVADRLHTEERDLKRAAALSELNKHKGIPWDPADDGFVFAKEQVEVFAQRLIRRNESHHIEHVRFYMTPEARPYANHRGY